MKETLDSITYLNVENFTSKVLSSYWFAKKKKNFISLLLAEKYGAIHIIRYPNGTFIYEEKASNF